MLNNRLLRRVGSVLTLGLCLSLSLAGAANAAPTGESAAASCPVPGQRFQIGTSNRVYLVTPDWRAWAIANEGTYFQLWGSYAGLTRWPGDTVTTCFGGAYLNDYAFLVKNSYSAKTYIFDSSQNQPYRWITSQAIFNKYKFNPAMIITEPISFNLISTNHWDY